MAYPLTTAEYQKQVMRETARMAYPSGMSRGPFPIVGKGTKTKVEEYFANVLDSGEVWKVARLAADFDAWHDRTAASLGRYLVRHKCLVTPRNQPYVVAAKFLNTFMHQLMKYEVLRPLWPKLHLPLDAKVFRTLGDLRVVLPESQALQLIHKLLGGQRAYSIAPKTYRKIQLQLWELISALNEREHAEFLITSRIELNLLWI